MCVFCGFFFVCPRPFLMGGGAYSITLVRTSVLYIRKWFPGCTFMINRCIGFIFHTQVYNHIIQAKFDFRLNPPIINSLRVMALDLRMKNGFRAISFENIGILDSYFIHWYIIIKYRSSSIMDKIHSSLFRVFAIDLHKKWFPGDIF